MPTKRANPFYVLLVLVGILFGITTCAYGVMTVKMSTAEGIASSADSPVVQFMSQHGLKLLVAELAVLGMTTFAAIGTDSYWSKEKP